MLPLFSPPSAPSIVRSHKYDPFGNVIAKTASLQQPYQWSSKETDPSAGLVYYWYRFYNPSLNRWLNRDPIGEIGITNVAGDLNTVSAASPLIDGNNYLFALNHTQGLYDADGRIIPLLIIGGELLADAVEVAEAEEAAVALARASEAARAARAAELAKAAERAAEAAAASRRSCPIPPILPDPIPEKCEKCKFTFLHYDLGGNLGHTAYLKSHFSTLNVLVTTPEGFSTSFDAADVESQNPSAVYEVKTGRQWSDLNPDKWSSIQDGIFVGDAAQFILQQSVATRCELKYEIWFNNNYAYKGYSRLLSPFTPYMKFTP